MEQLLSNSSSFNSSRFLSGDEATHSDHHDENTSSITVAKIIICICLFLSGLAVFFPFLKVVKDKKQGCCKG